MCQYFFKAENEPIVTIDNNKYCIDQIKAWLAWDLFVEIAWSHDVDPHEGWEEEEIISWLHRWNYVFDGKIWILAKDIWSNTSLKPSSRDAV